MLTQRSPWRFVVRLGLVLIGLLLSPCSWAAVTANITLNDFAAFQVRNPGKNSHLQVLLMRSDTADHQNTRTNAYTPQFTASGTQSSTSLTAGYYTVVAYHDSYASATGCETSPLTSYQHVYYADGATINIAVTCTMPDTTAPAPSSAATSVDGQTVSLLFDETTDYYGDYSEFVIKVDGTPVTITAGNFDYDMTFDFTVSPAITAGQTVTISLPANSEVYDYSGNQSPGFTDFAVTNNVVNTAPAGSLVFAASNDAYGVNQLYGYNSARNSAGLVMAANKFGAAGPKGQTYLLDNQLFGFFTPTNGAGGFGYFDGSSVTLLAQLDSLVDPRLQSFTPYQGSLYFTATDDSGQNYHLWRYNPQDQSVTKVSAAMNYVNATAVAVYNDKLYFGGSYTGTINNPSKLFYWDGSSITEAPGFATGAATPRFLKSYNNYLYLSASPANALLDTELYRYTDSGGGSVAKVAELTPSGNNNGSSTISFFTLFDNKLFFSVAYNFTEGRLYSVDSSNTVTVEYDPPLASNPNQPADLLVLDNKLYFQSVVTTTNREIIRYNSTGNVSVLTTFNPASTTVSSLVGYDGDLYFNINLGNGRELAKLELSDNTVTQLTNFNTAGDSLPTYNMQVLPFELAPVVTLAQHAGYFSVGGAALTPLSQVQINDIDGDGNLQGMQLQLQNQLSGDVLSFSNQLGISGSFDSNSGLLTLSGSSSIANYQTALATVSFDSSSLVSADRQLVVRAIDAEGNISALNASAATFTIRVTDKTLNSVDFNSQPVGLDKDSDSPATAAGTFAISVGALGTINFIATDDALTTSFANLNAVDGNTAGTHGFVWNDQQYGGVDSIRVISNYSSPASIAFASANGGSFDFDSFAIWDDGVLNSAPYYAQLSIYGYLDDVKVAEQIVPISLLKPARILLNSDFDEVDEIRMRYYDPLDPTFTYPYFWGVLDDFTFLENVADVTAPTISSLVRQSPTTATTASDTLVWRITFSENVTQVSSDDFTVSGSSAVVSAVTAISGSVYEVTVSGGDLASVTGTVTLALAAGHNIQDSAQNVLTDTTVGGSNENNFVLDNTAPVITAVSMPNSPLKIADQVTVTISVTADSDDYSLLSGTIAGFNLSGLTKVNDSTYTASFTVTAGSDIAGGTDLAVSLSLKDSLDNNSALFESAISQNADSIDGTRPSIVSVLRSNPTAEVTNADTVTWLLTFSEAVSGVTAADFQLFSTSTATISAVSSTDNIQWLVQASGGDLASYTGVVALQFALAYSINDNAGNAMQSPAGGQAIGGAQSYQLDNEAPLTPFDLGLELASDCGVSSSDRKTNDNTPTVLGNTSISDVTTVTLYRNGNVLLGSTNLLDCGAFGITSSQLSDGVHQLTAVAVDEAGNVSGTSAVLEVLIDTVVPTASASANAVTALQDGQSSYSFTVTYSDDSSGVDSSSFDGSDIVVTGPNSYQASASVSSSSGNVVTYAITPPGGSWDQSDAGSYSINLAASQVADVAGNFVAANASLTSFSVSYNAAPVNTGLPVVTGTVLVSAVLSGTTGSWSDDENDTLTYSYQWYRASDANGSAASPISQATASSYTLSSADAHQYIQLVVTVDDGQGNSSSTAASGWALVQNTAPLSVTAPVLTGSALVNGTLSSNTGTFSDIDADNLTYSYQWYRALDANGQGLELINSATASTYLISMADAHKYLKVIVTADDGQGGSISASSDWLVVNNSAPTISGSAPTTVAQGAVFSFSPSAADVDGDAFSFSISNKPVWLTLNPQTGELSGTPGNSDVGDYSNIILSVSDGVATVSLPAFSVSVSNVNDAPVISGSAPGTVAQGVFYSFTPTVVDVDANSSFSFSISNKPAWLTLNPQTGELSGTPGNSDVGDYSNIILSVSDGIETVSLPAFSINVSNVNDAPVISGNPATTVAQGVLYSFTPTVDDVDANTTLSYSITNKPAWLTLNPQTGELSGTPGNSDVGDHSNIILSVSDGMATVSLPAFSINVSNVNDAPVISGSAPSTVAQGALYSFTPTVVDVDANSSFSFSISNKPAWLTLNAQTGELSGTPGNSDVGDYSNLILSVSDGMATVSLPAFSINVSNVNDAPVITGSAPTTVAQGVPYSFTPTVVDVDANTTLSYSITNKPAWLTLNAQTGQLSGTPGNSDVGDYSNIILSVSDGMATVSLPAFSLSVSNVNDAPVISGSAPSTVAQGVLYSFTPTVVDVDANTTLLYSISNKPAWLMLNPQTGELSGTPGNSDVGDYSNLILSVSDGVATVSLPAFSINVSNVNDAPVISGNPATTVAQGVLYSFTPTVVDVDANTTLSYSITNKPAWLTLNAQTGQLSGTPGNSDVGDYSNIILSVSDGTVTVSLPAFSLSVSNVNDAPVISGSAPTTVAQGALYSFTPTVVDVDANTSFSFSISNKPGWLTFNPQTGQLSGTPGNSDVGDYSNIILSVSDGVATVSLPAFSLSVSNVNDAPLISGVPAFTVIANSAYNFVAVATDPDNDSLIFSISNKPAWAQFDTATGQLSGTPLRSDIGISFAVTISVSDGQLSTALPAFELQVLTDNTAPVAADADLSLNEDDSLLIQPQLSDAENNALSLEIVQPPEHGSLLIEGSALRYMPLKDFNGTDSFRYIARDQALSSEPATVQLTVNPVNDLPLAVADQFSLVRSNTDSYSLNVLVNDSDVDGDSLLIDGASSSVGSVVSTANGLQLQAPARYIGEINLRYTITDGQKGRASAAVKVVISGETAAELPVLTLPADLEVNATALFTRVALGVATAVDSRGQPLPVSLLTGTTFFAPGEHLAYWQATDSAGLSVTKAQKVKVNPLVSLSKDATVTEGSTVKVQFLLNGPAPVYPLTIPYTVSGSSNGQDHDLVAGEVVLQSGSMIELPVQIYPDNQSEGNETIVIELDPALNRGAKARTVLTISEQNVAPQASLAVRQQNENRLTVAQDQGQVTVTATVSDANAQDQLQLSWNTGQLTDVSIDGQQLRFAAASQAPGIYPVQLTVTDNGSPALSQTAEVYILLQPGLPVLSQVDTDGDLIPDDEEGFADTDGDGIADYLDAISDCNVVPEIGSQQVRFLAEGEAGICLRRGQVSAVADSGGLQLALDEVTVDPAALNVGGVFDFIAYGLPLAGQTYQLVLPQQRPVPANAVYRKFYSDRGWTDFITNDSNFISSSKGERGFCPPPGATDWTPGLTEGDWCVQITLTDGGPNDGDGLANNAIVDPGGVAVQLTSNSLPEAKADTASTRTGFAVEIDVLQNDTDADSDLLTISQASSQFGQVQILASQKLLYTPVAGFFGQDTVIYSVTDGKGGTASSEVTVTVQPNKAPLAVDDQAATDDRTAISLEVLKNDTDPDGDTLTLLSVTATQGTATVINGSTIRYQPKAGFAGTDTLTYLVADSYGATGSGKVTLSLQAYQEVMVINKAKGGASSGWWLALLLPLALLRRCRGSWLLALLPLSSQANWYALTEIGQSQAQRSTAALQAELASGELLRLDKRDLSLALGVGYQFSPQWAAELVWRDLGDAGLQLRSSTLDPLTYHQQVSQSSPYLGETVAVGGRWRIRQYQHWLVELLAGVQYWQTEVSSQLVIGGRPSTELSSDFSGTDLYYGVALGYQVSPQWQAQLQLQRSQVHINKVNQLALRLSWQF